MSFLSFPIKLLLAFSFLVSTTLAATTLYVDNSKTSNGNGSESSPYSAFTYVLTNLASLKVTSPERDYIIRFNETATPYLMPSGFALMPLKGFNMTFTSWKYDPLVNGTLNSTANCSSLAQMAFNAGTFTADFVVFDGITFTTASSYVNYNYFVTLNFTASNVCYKMNTSPTVTNSVRKKDSSSTVEDAPSEDAAGYLMRVTAYNSSTLCNVTIQNSFIIGDLASSPILSATYVNKLNLTNITMNYLPQINAITNETIIKGWTYDRASSPTQVASPFDSAKPCFSKISYLSGLNLTDFNMNNLNITAQPYFFCFYQSTVLNTQVTNMVQNLTISNITFSNNSIGISTSWGLFYAKRSTNIETVTSNVNISNVTVTNNTIKVKNSTYSDNFLMSFLTIGCLQANNVTFVNNTNLKSLYFTSENTQLPSNLDSFTNLQYINNTWTDGTLAVNTFVLNPNMTAAMPIPITTNISNITIQNNTLSKSFMTLTNQALYFDLAYLYLTPRAWITNITVNNTQITSATVFLMQVYNLDWNNTWIMNSSFVSANFLQSSSGAAPLQVNNVTIQDCNMSNSNLIYKIFDTTTLTEYMSSDLENNTTPIPLSLFVNNFYSRRILLNDYSRIFRIKGAPTIIIKASEFTNLTLNSSSNVLLASDMLSLLTTMVFNAASVLGGGFQRYLQYINNTNLTASFMQSLPINESLYELAYATSKYSMNSVVYMYRVVDCAFNNLSLNGSNLVDLSAISLNQSVISVDRNNFTAITVSSWQDSFIKGANVKLISFAYNELKQIKGSGAVLSQTGVSFLTMTNNYLHDNAGSSFLRTNTVSNKGLFIGNNTINNITASSTFISISILQNSGQVIFRNNTFSNCSIVSDAKAYKQLNFILIDNQMTDTSINVDPNFHIKNCSFTGISLYKNHSLIKQYLNSFLVASLAADSLAIENSKFDNISVRYDSNLLFIVTKDLKINATNISNIENNEKVGSLYLLTVNTLINNSRFINNSASAGLGGAIYIDYDSIKTSGTNVTIMNSLFMNNSASEGSAIYYSTRAINFTAYNNQFINCLIPQDSGSLITFFNATLNGINMTSNIVYYTTNVNYFTKLFNFDTTTAASGANITINKTTIRLTKSFTGTLFNIYNTKGSFTFDGLVIYNDTSAANSTNKFSLMDLVGGNVTIKNAGVYSLASNIRPFIDVVCEKTSSSYLQVQDSVFSGLTSTMNSDSISDAYDYNYRGIIHLSNRLGSTECVNNSVVVKNTKFEKFNYEYYNTRNFLDASAITVDYNGQFTLNVQDSQFNQLGASQGSAILLVNSVSNANNQIIIKNNTFNSVISKLEGGAIYNNLNSLQMYGNQFTSCSSLQRSGAAFYSQTQLDFATLKANNTFSSPYRYYDFTFRDSLPLGSVPSLLNLSFAMPSYIISETREGVLYLTNFSSYDLQEINISSVLIDSIGQRIYDTSSASSSNAKEFTLYISGTLGDFTSCPDYTCTMKEPNVVLTGNASQVFEGQFNYKSSLFQLSSSKFYIVLRECINGELDSTVTGDYSGAQCTPCPADKYGLDVKTDKQCHACPDNAKCTGGINILANAGYWRQNTSTTTILQCRTSSYCLGGFASTCATGHMGLLCDSCNTTAGYVKVQSGCKACPGKGTSLILSLMAFTIVLFYQLWYIKTTRVSNTFFVANVNSDLGRVAELKISQGMHVRLLTTYAQILGIIATFGLDFTPIIQTLGSILEGFSDPELSLFSSIECSFRALGLNADKFVYYRVLLAVFSPVIKGLLLLLYRLVYWKFKVNEKRFSILVVTGVCLFLLEQPSISQQLFGFLTCTQVAGYSKHYLQQDLRYECYTPEYYSFRKLVVIPGLLIYVVLLPLFFFVILWKNKNENGNYNSKIRMYFGAIYNEYTPRAYFWGIYLILTKSVLMFLKSSLDFDVKTKALSVFIILYIYYALFVKLHPLQRKDLHQVETFALISYLMTIFGSIYYKDNTSWQAQLITLVAITILNGYVMILLGWGISKIYFERVRTWIGLLVRKHRGENKLDIDFSFETNDVSKDSENEAGKGAGETLSFDEIEARIFGADDKKKVEEPAAPKPEKQTEMATWIKTTNTSSPKKGKSLGDV